MLCVECSAVSPVRCIVAVAMGVGTCVHVLECIRCIIAVAMGTSCYNYVYMC